MVGDAPPSAATGAKRFAWSIYDFANSGYTTVVLTTVFNAYFVAVVAGGRCMSAPGRKRTVKNRLLLKSNVRSAPESGY